MRENDSVAPWLAFALGLFYVPGVFFIFNRWEQRHPAHGDSWRGAVGPTTATLVNPDPIEPNPQLEGQAAAVFATLLLRSPGALLIWAAAVSLIFAGLLPAYMIEGGDGMKQYGAGGFFGVVGPIAGLLAYGQVVWRRTGAWPQPWGRSRRFAKKDSDDEVERDGHD